jgi:CBS domain containing-hemolysin-like protein
VPETLPVDELLARLQAERAHMSFVIDEYGGLAGIVTLEDVLESLVGQIQDEFELLETEVEQLPDGALLVNGLVPLDEFNRRFGVTIASEAVETLGGLVFELLGRKPELGDCVYVDGYSLTVAALDGLRIARLRLEALSADGDEER